MHAQVLDHLQTFQVLTALQWLKENNPFYRDINILTPAQAARLNEEIHVTQARGISVELLNIAAVGSYC